MTGDFDERNAAKSRAVCERLHAEAASRGLTGRERRILDMWPKYEDGEYVWFGDRVGLVDGGDEVLCQVHVGETGYSLYTETHDEWHDSGDVVECPARSVLDADGVEIKVGDTVWSSMYGDNDFTVSRFSKNCKGETLVMVEEMGSGLFPETVTHTRPDSWGRLEEDARRLDIDLGDTADDYPRMSCVRDIVRRARALAGVEVPE